MRSRSAAIVLVALVVLVSACSDDEPEERILSTPAGVVGEWLGGLETLDLDALVATTDPANVALVAGAENDFDVGQMVAVVESGLPEAALRSYWTTFRDGLVAFIEPPLSAVSVGSAERFAIDGRQHAAVIVSRGDAETEIITTLSLDGWKVDLTATTGPALAVQVRRLVARTVAEAEDDVARRYARIAVESLGAALERDPDNRALDLEVEAIQDLPIDLGS